MATAGSEVRGSRRAEPAPTPRRERRRASPSWPLVLWVLVTLAGLGLCLSGWSRLHTPDWLPYVGAVIVTATYAVALGNRSGGLPVTSGVVMAAIATAAVVSEEPVLLSGVAVATAAEAGVLGMLVTRPAARFFGVLRELVIAILVASVAAFAVEAYQAPISIRRTTYLALGLALLGSFALAWRLGAGFSGLGRRGATAVTLGAVLLVVALAYTEALSRWGAGDVLDNLGDALDSVHDNIGALPRPTAYLLGFPALIWGVYVRARRRQGWWVCAFGSAGLVVVATSLLDPGIPLSEAGISLGYTIVLGVIVGFVVLRVDNYLTGTRGRRARQLEEQSAHRPEPGRTQPLT